MKASHLFLLGVIFAFAWNIIRGLVDGVETTADWNYTIAEVFVLIFFITLWYSIDNHLNKKYKVTRWDA